MHLIAPLASGLADAANGSVTFYERGTTIVANYYADFEATQLLSGQSVLLDSNGSLVAYVAALVDVEVKNDLGVVVREFVAGAHDAAVEVISPSFTGTDYTSGAVGTQKPTDLGRVLDAWLTSAGSPDWKVLVGGVATTMQAAVALAAATFFNVKTYGALGNGTGDDTAAITATITAAVAAGGGTVFFPPGVYRVVSAITLPGSVTLLGSGGMASKLAIDSGVGAGAITLGVNGVGALSCVNGLWIGALGGATPGALVQGGGGATGEFHFTDCVLGNDAICNSNLYANQTSLAAFKAVFARCYAKVSTGSAIMFDHRGAGRLTVRDCDLVSNQAFPGDFIRCDDGGLIEGNLFDGTAATLGTFNYIRIAPATDGMVAIIGNRFAPNVTVIPVAILNALATPNRDCMEYGNVFGSVATGPLGITPYEYFTDGYSAVVSTLPTSAHGSRYGRTEGHPASAAATVTVNPKAYGTTVVQRTAGAALTVNANRGSPGDKWTLFVECTPGVTISAGTNIIFDATVAPFVVGALTRLMVQLEWVPQAAGIVGVWRQSAKAVIS
jgi:hypothetical protein